MEVAAVEVLIGLLVATAASGVVPLVNAELMVVAATVSLPSLGVPVVAAVATMGQMATKLLLFELARRAPNRLSPRGLQRLEGARARLVGGGGTAGAGAAGSVVFLSAATGVPPFYGVSLASGALGMRVSTFLVGGSTGRFLRFLVIAWLGRSSGAGAGVVSGAQLLGPVGGV